MNIRVVVADERVVNFFDVLNAQAPLLASGSVSNPTGGLKDRDLDADREGRGSSRAGSARHGVDGESSTERHNMEVFARDVGRTLDAARTRHEFDRLVIIAGPRMLGLIRGALPAACKPLVAAEVPKDLAQHAADVIREAVPPEVFSSLTH